MRGFVLGLALVFGFSPVCVAVGLIESSNMGDETKVEVLLRNGANVNQTGELGLTALHHAVFSSNRLVVKTLLKYGADINAINDEGETPLIYAIRKDSYSVLKTLLENGADLTVKDKHGGTALYYLSRKKNKRYILTLVKYMKETETYGDGDSSTHLLSSFADKRTLSLYIKNTKPDLNIKDSNGLTPLDYAAVSNNWKGVELLLSKGANPLLSHLNGGYLISQAILRKKSKLLQVIIKDVSDLEVSIKGWTPLMLSSLNKCFTCIDVLLKKNVSIDFTTNGFSPLHIAAQVDGVRVASRLIKAGANKEDKTRQGTTPLMHASRHGSIKVAELLLKNGVSADATDIYGRNALFYAYPEPGASDDSRYESMLTLLKKHGVSPSETDKNGETAFQYYTRRKKEYEYRLAEAERRRQEQERERLRLQRLAEKEKEESGFNWMKFGALTTGFVAGNGLKLDSSAQIETLSGIIRDSQAGVNGISNTNKSISNTVQRYKNQSSRPVSNLQRNITHSASKNGNNITLMNRSSNNDNKDLTKNNASTQSAYKKPPNKMANIIIDVGKNDTSEIIMLRNQCIEQCDLIQDRFESTGCKNTCYSKFAGENKGVSPTYSSPSAIAE